MCNTWIREKGTPGQEEPGEPRGALMEEKKEEKGGKDAEEAMS